MDTTKLDTVRLKDGSEYPLASSWGNLTDKPFYTETTETVLLPESELTFPYQKSVNAYCNDETDASVTVEKWLGDWDHAIVVIDGARYKAQKRLYQGALPYVGDIFRMTTGAPVTGEPFLFACMDGSHYDIAVFPDAAPEDPDNAPDVTHTVSVTLVRETVKKLDDMYQHQPDWNNADKDSASCIRNRPFGPMAEDGAVWAETDFTWSAEDGAAFIGIDIAPLLYAEKIMLEVEGEKYLSSEIHRGDGIPDGAIEVGFADADGNLVFSGMALPEEVSEVADALAFGAVDETGLTDGQTIHVKVTVFGSRKQLDKDYLPILDKQSKAVLDSLVKFSYDTELGNWVSSGIAVTKKLYDRLVKDHPLPKIFVDSDTYIGTGVRWSESTGYESGNPHLLNTYNPDNGVPYAIQVKKSTADDVITYVLTIRLVGDAPEDTSTTQTHYINLRFQGVDDTCTIDPEYIPSPPEFDLSTMGLPDIPIGGDAVSVECDTADLRAALDKGLVKLKFKATSGSVASAVTYAAAAINMDSTYQVSFVGMMGAPMLFSIVVTSTKISAQILQLAVPTAAVSEEA